MVQELSGDHGVGNAFGAAPTPPSCAPPVNWDVLQDILDGGKGVLCLRDKELRLLAQMVDALEQMDEGERRRSLEYLCCRYKWTVHTA